MSQSNGHAAAFQPAEQSRPASPWFDPEKLTKWIEFRSNPERLKYRCSWFMLNHQTTGGLTPCSTLEILKTLDEPDRINRALEITDQFAQAAQTFADNYPTPQLFIVSCHVSDKPGEHAQAHFPFRIQPPPEIVESFGGTEAPNTEGVIAALQRQNELLLRGAEKEKERLVSQNARLLDHIERMEDKNWKGIEKREELADQSALRDVQVHKAKIETEFQQQIWNKLTDVGFPILAKVAEKAAGVDGTKEHPLMAFARKLKPKQLAAFVDSLEQELRDEFAPLGDALVERMTDEQRTELVECMTELNAKRAAAEASGIVVKESEGKS